MLNAIGEATVQHTVRANHDSEMYGQNIAVKKSHQIKEQRPIEKTGKGSKAEIGLKKEEDTKRKNAFEDGNIIVEEYNENGEIVRKTPPGYVLGNEMA